MTNIIPYIQPKLQLLLSGHHHKLQNLQEAMNVTILHINILQCESQLWNKVNSISMKLRELIFCYTVALKILNELCFIRKCLEKALRANSNVRKIQFRFIWLEERLGKILQRRDRAGARVRRGDNFLRSTINRYLPNKKLENCYEHLVDDFAFIRLNQISNSEASKLSRYEKNSNCRSRNSIFNSGKLSSPTSHMVSSSSTSHISSKTICYDDHDFSHSGSQLFSSVKKSMLSNNQMRCFKFAPGYINPYFGNRKNHNSSEYNEKEKIYGELQTSLIEREKLYGLSLNSIPIMKLSNSKNLLEIQNNYSQINSEINSSNLPFIYRKRDIVYLPYLECCCLFFKAQIFYPISNSHTYPQNLNFPSCELFNPKLFNSCSEDLSFTGIEQVNLISHFSIDKNMNTHLSDLVERIPPTHTILPQNRLVVLNSLKNISSFSYDIDHISRIDLLNSLQYGVIKIKDLGKLLASCHDVIVCYKIMKIIISINEIIDDFLMFSLEIFNISNWRLHFDLLRQYRIFLPKFDEISFNLIDDFKNYLDLFSISQHHELIVESSLLLRYYFPSEQNEIILKSALLDNSFKLYWIIICTFFIKYGKPSNIVIITILARLTTETHEKNRLQLAKLIGYIKDWEFELYNHCYNVLSKLLWEDHSRNVRIEIGKIMIQIGMSKEIIKENLDRLEHDDKHIRLRAVKSLGSFHLTNSKCIRKLLEILEIDSSMAVKLETIKTLSFLSIHESKILPVIFEKSRGEGYIALEAQKALKILQQ